MTAALRLAFGARVILWCLSPRAVCGVWTSTGEIRPDRPSVVADGFPGMHDIGPEKPLNPLFLKGPSAGRGPTWKGREGRRGIGSTPWGCNCRWHRDASAFRRRGGGPHFSSTSVWGREAQFLGQECPTNQPVSRTDRPPRCRHKTPRYSPYSKVPRPFSPLDSTCISRCYCFRASRRRAPM